MSQHISTEGQVDHLTYGSVDVIRLDELRKKLDRSRVTGKPLTVKVGFDPTAPDLHLGHAVLIRKMKHFQDLGHTVIFVVGDFTAMIGDPTGRSKTRPPLSSEDIRKNADTYKAQIFKILDRHKTQTRFNSEWLEQLGSDGWIKLAAKYNVARMLERRDFKQRYEEGRPIAIHEFLYPLAQAYDSVVLKADVELGGTDQLFNLNVGRDIMPAFNLEPQVVMTTPILEGLDGVEKMSKSLGNYVALTDAPTDMFGKIMSISDELMWKYYSLLTDFPFSEIEKMRASVESGRVHPKKAKIELAKQIVKDFHGQDAAESAEQEFERVFTKKELPVPVFCYVFYQHGLGKLLEKAGLATSSSDAVRKIQQGAVRINGERVTDYRKTLPPGECTVQIGRKAVRLRVLQDEDVVVEPDRESKWKMKTNEESRVFSSRDEAIAEGWERAHHGVGKLWILRNGELTDITDEGLGKVSN